MIAASNRGISRAAASCRTDLRLQPQPRDRVAGALPRVDLDLAAGARAVAILGADARLLDADRPDPPGAAEQRAQPVDRGQEVAAVPLHHRQQQVAAGVPAQPRVLEHRQPRQQHPPRLLLVPRERQRAFQHVARRQHPELVAQLPRAPAAVEHRHDGIQRQPRVGLEPAEQARQTRAAAKTPDVQLPQMHESPIIPRRPAHADGIRDSGSGVRDSARFGRCRAVAPCRRERRRGLGAVLDTGNWLRSLDDCH